MINDKCGCLWHKTIEIKFKLETKDGVITSERKYNGKLLENVGQVMVVLNTNCYSFSTSREALQVVGRIREKKDFFDRNPSIAPLPLNVRITIAK